MTWTNGQENAPSAEGESRKPRARAIPGFPRLMVLHQVQAEGKLWFAYRIIVGPLGIVSTDKSRPCAMVEAAGEWARGDATRIAAELARIRNTIERHADECDADAVTILSDAQGYRDKADKHRAESVRLRQAADEAKRRASTLLSAVEAAKYRILGGKRVEVSSLQPREMVRADAIPAREPEEQRAQLLVAQAVEQENMALEHEAGANRMVEQAGQRRNRAAELRTKARHDGDAYILSQRGREWTW